MPVDERARVAPGRPVGDHPACLGTRLGPGARALAAGGHPAPESEEPGKMHNSSLLIDPQGQLASRYDKLHLFGFCTGQEQYDEAATMTPGPGGGEPSPALGRAAPRDLLRPALPGAVSPGAAPDFIALPAAFTHTTGLAHWALLLQARAVENLAFVFASAQGTSPRWAAHLRPQHDHRSLGPDTGPGRGVRGMAIATLDLAAQRTVRSQLPALTHRKIAVGPLRPAPFSTLGMTPHFKGLTMKLNTLMMLMALATAGQAAAKPW